MTWYAIKTQPGSQVPQREFVVETTRSTKGYRIVPSLNPQVSAIERSLSDAGFVHYMPVEKRLVRDRLRTDLWKVRRFALLTGYIFVQNPDNWLKLSETPGVQGVIAYQGVPQPVALLDILMMRSEEAKAEAEFDRTSREAVKAVRRKAKTHPELRKFADRLELFETVDIGALTIPKAA